MHKQTKWEQRLKKKASVINSFQVRDQQPYWCYDWEIKYLQKGSTMSRQNGRFFLVFLQEHGRHGIA